MDHAGKEPSRLSVRKAVVLHSTLGQWNHAQNVDHAAEEPTRLSAVEPSKLQPCRISVSVTQEQKVTFKCSLVVLSGYSAYNTFD